jgi:hypothetical protein
VAYPLPYGTTGGGHPPLSRDMLALHAEALDGGRVLSQNLASSWWDWNKGSALMFWRWNGIDQQRAARFGFPICVKGDLPRWTKPQRPPAPDKIDLVAAKLLKVLSRGYIAKGVVLSLVNVFDVPKGLDVRLVYDGSASGLNSALWAPNFYMPNANCPLRKMSFGTKCGDADLSDMFLNFPMDPLIRPYSGVDLTPLSHLLEEFSVPAGEKLWMHWTRLFMGMRPSPYLAARYAYLAEELARGPAAEETGPFRFDYIKFNIPGQPDYDPSLNWVTKWNALDSAIAGDVVTFMDDLRTLGFSVENAWQVGRRIMSRYQYLGIQDAARKRRPPSSTPGSWAGTVHRASEDNVTKTVTQEKWDKGKAIIQSYSEIFAQPSSPTLDFVELRRSIGFLVHLAMTFSIIMPYLKGWFNTMNAWRAGRDADGWKLPQKELEAFLSENFAELFSTQDFPPSGKVQGLPLMKDNVEALHKMFEAEAPPEFSVKSKKILIAFYGFGDASGNGFGSSLELGNGLSIRVGIWTADESSNWREFTNVTEALEEEAERGNLFEVEVFFCTDNSTVELCFYKGSSRSEKLHHLVVRVRALEIKFSIRIHLCHVAGTRMIAQGGDGLSRGLLNEGVMNGQDMLSFLAFHKSPLELSGSLEPWVRSWLGESMETLEPLDWFERGHDIAGWSKQYPDQLFPYPEIKPGLFLWAPPPGAAIDALEELRKARIKRQDSTHVFVCQRLLTPTWFKPLYKAADIVFEIPARTKFWPATNFEPLIVGICFPFCRNEPWQLRSTPKMFAVARQLSKMWEGPDVDVRDFLREFCIQMRRLGSMPKHVVSRMLYLS